MNRVVISMIGLSLLFKVANPEERNLINRNSNKKEEDIDQESKKIFEDLLEKINSELNLENARNLSAELNGMLGIDEISKNIEEVGVVFHHIIPTDTYLCNQVSKLVKSFLESNNINVNILQIDKLNLLDEETFNIGINNLIKNIIELDLNGYKESGYKVQFNLAAGFKGIQGIMVMISNLYADESFYIFEKSKLIKIPRMPINIDYNIFKGKELLFEKLYIKKDKHIDIKIKYDKSISESLVDVKGDKMELSYWGNIVWGEYRKTFLKNEFITDYKYIEISDLAKKTFKEKITKQKDKNIELQNKLVKIELLMEKNNGNVKCLIKDNEVHYSDYKGKEYKKGPDKRLRGEKVGHFRLNKNDNDRVSCVYYDNKIVILNYGKHDFINEYDY